MTGSSTLKTIRLRLLAAAAAEAALPPVAAALAALALVAGLDAVWGAPRWLRYAALVVSAALGAWALARLVRAIAFRDWSLLAVARRVAPRAPGAPNALVTWLELGTAGEVAPYVASRLDAAASAEASALDAREAAPLGGAALSAALVAAAAASLSAPLLGGYDLARLARPEPPAAASDRGREGAAGDPSPADALRVTVVPPPYTGRGAERFEAPVEVVALAGSRVEVELLGGPETTGATLEVNGAPPEPMRGRDGASDGERGAAFVASFAALEGGSIAVRPSGPGGEREPFVLPVRVEEDRAPEVRITKPAGDLLVEPSVRPRTLEVAFEASDDFGLGALRLRYIRSTGEGDAAEFVDGDVPVEVTSREGARVAGRCTLDLDALGVVPGAALVYHVEARDRNAVSGPSTGLSESLVFEVASPEQVAAITIEDLRPEDVRRFLVSQRMILENTLALHARRGSMEREAFVARSTEIARQQREFKESFDQFVEIHDAAEPAHDHAKPAADAEEEHGHEAPDAGEATATPDAVERAREAHESAVEARTETHTHGSAEPSAGPASGVYRDLLEAVRAMWDAERSLGIAETGEAIPAERRALEHLKRAQRAVRYFPRIAVKTKPIDLKRRFSGELDDLKSRVERLAAREVPPEERAMRDSLAALLAHLRSAAEISPEAGAAGAGRARDLAAEVARAGDALLDVESGYEPELVAAAARCSAAAADARRLAEALAAGDVARARSAHAALGEALLGAATRLAALLDSRGAVRAAPAPAAGPSGDRRRAADYFRRLAGAGG